MSQRLSPDLSPDRLLLAADIAGRRLVRAYGQYAEAEAPSFAQGAALLVLGRHDGALPAQLARALALAPSGVTTLLRRLEGAGYITRSAHKRDKRAQRLHLTDHGRAAMVAFSRSIRATEAALTVGLTPPERAAALKFMAAIIQQDDDDGL